MPDNGEQAANLLASALNRIAEAVIPYVAVPSDDAADTTVSSLTEAVMGVTAGLCRIAEAGQAIAEAINGVAEEIKHHGESGK
jgi:hypothetical protein